MGGSIKSFNRVKPSSSLYDEYNGLIQTTIDQCSNGLCYNRWSNIKFIVFNAGSFKFKLTFHVQRRTEVELINVIAQGLFTERKQLKCKTYRIIKCIRTPIALYYLSSSTTFTSGLKGLVLLYFRVQNYSQERNVVGDT